MKRIGGIVGVLVLAGLGQAASLTPAAPAGLQAEYNFSEGSGATTVGDSSGSDFHASLQNGAAFAPGRVGFGIALDGVDDFVNLGDNRNLIRSSPAATVALWVKPGSVIPSGNFRELVSLSVGASSPTKTSRIALSLKGEGSTGGQIFLGGRSTDAESQKNVTTAQGVAVGTWTHVAGVVDFQNSTLKVWIDGQVAATATGVGFASALSADTPCRNSALGAQDDGLGNAFHGVLDQARIYNRALSDAEIQALASADELRAHWTLDEGSGLVASDASGNQNTGSLKNGLDAGWIAGGQVGGALQFDGVDDYVEVTSAPGLLRNVNGASVALWIKPSSVIPAGQFRELASISIGGSPSDVSRFALALRGDSSSAGDVFLGGRSADGETQKSTLYDSSLVVGEWVHVCGVVSYQAGTLEVYINGILAASAPAAFQQPSTANTGSPSIALGAQDRGTSNFFGGSMDAVRVYGRALTACEVQELAGRDGLEAYWKFDESSGTVASDSSATGLAATLKNGASFVPGLRGNALSLDGVDDYADLGLNLPILSRGANAATVAAWINLGSVPPSGAFREIVSIAVGGSPSNTSRLALAVKGTAAGTADLFAGGRSTDSEAQQTLTAVAGIQPGVWRHVAATLDVGHNAIRIYLDGAQIASANVAFSQPTMPTTSPAVGAIGAQDTGDSNRIHARIDEARIYCRVLSAAEIASLAAPAAPAAPVLSLVEEGDQQAKLAWTGVPGADFYNVKRSTTQGSGYVTIASPGGTNHTDLGLTNGVTYFYVVTAQNAAGESPNSNEVDATPMAGVPPAPVIVSPASGAILNTALPTVSGTSSSSGLTITLFVDGSENGTTVSGVAGNWTMTPATALAEGLHNLTATATSGAGTSPASAAVSIRVDTMAPVISSPQPPDGSSTTNTTPTISAAWSDPSPGSGINTASAVIKLDNVTVSASVNATGFSFTPSALSLGSHTVSAQVSDLGANPSNLLTWSFSVVAAPTDTTPPVISNLIPLDGSFTPSRRPQLSADLSDSGGSGMNAGSVVMMLNGVVVPASVTLDDPNNGSVTFDPTFDLGEGSNAVSVTAQDNAGNSASSDSGFVVDSVTPVINLSSPLPGSAFASLAVPLDATALDERSGVVPGSITVLLNTVDITSSVTRAEGGLNSFGFPNQITLTATLSASPGTNTLHIFATDAAGNLAAATSVFEAQGAPPPPPPAEGETLVLTKVKGDGQEGLVDEVLKDSLVVQATVNGVPVEQFRLLFQVIEGDGQIVGSFEGKNWGTDGGGMAGISFIPTLGANRIRVTAAQSDANASVEFSVTGKNPTVELLPTPVPVIENVEVGHYGLPGGALSLPRIFRAKDHTGAPRKNVVVRPGIVNASGQALSDFSHIGFFVPEYALTDDDGKAEFAFRISDGAQFPQTIFLRGFLPRYKDENDKPIESAVASGDILHPQSTPSTVTFTPPQAQVALTNTLMPQDLGMLIESGNFIMRMCVTSGEGSLLPGTGDFRPIDFAPNGDIRVADSQLTGQNSSVTIKYRKGPKNTPAIIALYAISSPGNFLHSYVVAPTEVAIVRRGFQKNADGTLARDSQGEPIAISGTPYEQILQPRDYIPHAPFFDPDGGIQTGAPEFEIFLEARLPIGTPQASASIKSVALDGGPAPVPPGVLLPLQLTLDLTNAEPGPEGRFLIRRSDPTLCVAPFSLGGSVPTGTETPAGQKLLHCPNETLLEGKLVTPMEFQAEKKKTVPPLIVLIGIDGMGQDIYSTAKFRIENDLLKDALGTVRATEIQNVQSVYPSVTYTAVGSILDGKTPRETGARTELFLRDSPLTLPYLQAFLDVKAKPTTRRHFALAAGANPRTLDSFNCIMAALANQVAASSTLKRGGFMNVTSEHDKGSWAVFTANYFPPIGEGLIGGGGEGGQIGTTGEYHRISKELLNMDLFTLYAYLSFAMAREESKAEALDQNTFDLARERAKGKSQRHFYVWFSGYDHFAHDAAGNDTVLTEYLGNNLVQGAGVITAFDNKLREYVTFAIFSDHGTTRLSKDPANVIDFKTEMVPLLTSQGYKVFSDPDFLKDRVTGSIDELHLVVTYHDIMAEVFVRDFPAGWGVQPSFSSVLGIADIFLRANAGKIGTGFAGKLDMILVRDSTGPDGFNAPYQVYETSKTLSNPVANPPTSLDAWAARNPRPEYVDNWVDHLKAASFIRSGDVMLIPKWHADVASRVQFFRESEHGHGGLSKREMQVPLVIGYAGTAKAMREITLGKADKRKAALQAANKLNMASFDTFILDMLDMKK